MTLLRAHIGRAPWHRREEEDSAEKEEKAPAAVKKEEDIAEKIVEEEEDISEEIEARKSAWTPRRTAVEKCALSMQRPRAKKLPRERSPIAIPKRRPRPRTS